MNFPLTVFKVADKSMEPTLHSGDFVVVNRLSNPKSGDVVVLRHPEKEMLIIKRVQNTTEDSLIVMGDNATVSQDSRDFGPVSKKNVVGKIVWTFS